MKKNLLIMAVVLFSIVTASFAQSTAETPRNYKPKAKELLPMPGELTEAMIFPVLGQYEFTNKDSSVATVSVTRDADNKGVIWISGLPQGMFKADLKASPSTYKIPAQKTLLVDSSAATDSSSGSATRLSGKSIQEGTLILDTLSNKLYVNLGAKFNEDNPAVIFPELNDTTAVTDASVDDVSSAVTKKPSKKKPVVKSTTYILTKIVDVPEESTNANNN